MFSDKKMKAAGLFGKPYDRLEKVLYLGENPYPNVYLREIWYGNLDYDKASSYYKKTDYPKIAEGCSSMCNENFLARNYDWLYDNTVTFIVHTDSRAGRYKTLGVANLPSLTKSVVNSDKYNDDYVLLPFHLLDGINEHGLAVSTNVVPAFDDQYGKNLVVNPGNPVEVSTRMLVRYLLDNCKNLTEVKNTVNNILKIYTSKDLSELHYTQHYIIKDGSSCTILEFIDGTPVWLDGKNIMTNFHIYGTDFNDDGKIKTPEDRTDSDTDFIEDHGAGLERYNYIVSNLTDTSDVEKLKSILNNIVYTNAYKFIDLRERPADGKVWYSEFSGIVGLKASDTKAKYEESGVLEVALDEYNKRSRDKAFTWQTVHSSIYDVKNGVLHLRTEEGAFVDGYTEFKL